MGWSEQVEKWLAFADLEQDLRLQLEEMLEQPLVLEEAFYQHLSFGTAGLRGELGPGLNRMNVYTVRRAAAGLARYLVSCGEEAKRRGVVIAYDSRRMSPEFGLEVAKVVGNYGIQVYLFDALRPTPLLSFAVRHLQAFSGVVITASHNPANYNGFKVYDENGGQLPPEAANQIVSFMEAIADELSVEVADETALLSAGLLTWLGTEVDAAYLTEVEKLQLNRSLVEQVSDDLKIVFTPLHGTGNLLVREGLARFGFRQVTVVKEQELPNGDFPTVKSPNPEDLAAFRLAMAYGEREGADLLMATDPDADRLGIAVRNPAGAYELLTGNQIAVLMLAYLLSQGKHAKDGVVIKSIVSTELVREMAAHYQLETIDVLTGFKFIGEKIAEFEQTKAHTFLFGFEESYGYLLGTFCRDKDAVQAAVFCAEMAAHYHAQGQTVYQGLMTLYEQFGYYQERTVSLVLSGLDGLAKMKRLMQEMRTERLKEVAGIAVAAVEDYQTGDRFSEGQVTKMDLPCANVLKYYLVDGSWFCIRPSGTEPKVKCYCAVKGESFTDAEERLKLLEAAVLNKVNSIVE